MPKIERSWFLIVSYTNPYTKNMLTLTSDWKLNSEFTKILTLRLGTKDSWY